jgi:hypothetical protein
VIFARFDRIARALFGAWGCALLEILFVLAVHRREVASVWEGQNGTLLLLPTLVVAASAFGVLGGVFYLLLEQGTREMRLAAAGLFGVLITLVGYGIGGGRLLSALPVRLGFALSLGALAGAGLFVASARLRALLAKPRWLLLASAALLLALELVNRFALVRLYPAFHAGLGGLTLALAGFTAAALPAEGGERGRVFGAAGALVALSLLVPWSATLLSRFDNYRFILLESAPLAGRAVELAARVSPPLPAEATGALVDPPKPAPGSASAGARAVDFRGRDFLLVTVDALRADHVGAYGYERPTTKHLDALARSGAVFERAYTATPHTSYALTSLMTGKYMRPLLLQDIGVDSDTWAGLLRLYGYRTAAFYPPAVFFIDPARFKPFRDRSLDFEYRWVEFAEGERRIGQVKQYLASTTEGQRLFMWVHLFGPHEPYEPHAEYPFGDHDIDRYDAEVAAADATLGAIVKAFRDKRPNAVVMVTADHGEEFGEHGGRYHGTSVYEEQVRVPLVISAPGAIAPQRVSETVELVDLLPTVLGGLEVPVPPRLRGRDLGPLLAKKRPPEAGFAYAETEDQQLLAEGMLRLVCARRVGACRLFDLSTDPGQKRDVAGDRGADFTRLRDRLREFGASHGRYELGGLRREGKGWPAPILRAIAGDADATSEVTELLDDADVNIRRKAAEVLFELKQAASAPALRLALSREEDAETRRWAALGLTRLGQGAPLVNELLDDPDVRFRRLAALALAEAGDARGEALLVGWWRDEPARDFERSRQILEVFAALRTKDAAFPLVRSLGDVRLRPYIARALARIGDDEVALGPLLKSFREERLQSTRAALAEALVGLGAKEELALPFRRFLGVPDPLPGGVGLALSAGILEHVGGPTKRDLARLQAQAELGNAVNVVVPPGGNGRGCRVIVRAQPAGEGGEVLVSSAAHLIRFDREGKLRKVKGIPELDAKKAVRIPIPKSEGPVEASAVLPASIGVRSGSSTSVIVYASGGVKLEALVVVPLADELPPPAPEPWKP